MLGSQNTSHLVQICWALILGICVRRLCDWGIDHQIFIFDSQLPKSDIKSSLVFQRCSPSSALSRLSAPSEKWRHVPACQRLLLSFLSLLIVTNVYRAIQYVFINLKQDVIWRKYSFTWHSKGFIFSLQKDKSAALSLSPTLIIFMYLHNLKGKEKLGKSPFRQERTLLVIKQSYRPLLN